MGKKDYIIDSDDFILVTGASGFIALKVVKTLLEYGFMNLRCFVRPSSNFAALHKLIPSINTQANVEIIKGNLLSPEDCVRATKDVSIIFHLAAGVEKSFPGAYMNSVVTTRNLLEAVLKHGCIKRFLNVSSFAVYSNMGMKRGALLDETCDTESHSASRGEAYCYGKVKQDELILEYGEKYKVPYVLVRPGVVFGPGKKAITGRVGIDTFGFFLHLGGSNKIPFTYIDNCAEAIVLAGIKKGVDGEIFNIVDDNLPTSRKFLKMYKKNVGSFRSLYVPYRLFYLFSYLWEKYSDWSKGQLPPVFNRYRCAADWKGNRYSNKKLKELLGWTPRVPFDEALEKYFQYQREAKRA